ncbi:protein phosphatase 1 regulatory subunit 3E-like [Conger conger]|uniref:protein phosphatase 1 regulatory subunit 3E-like n=1 Tax=Conger conger TaxID=82655 RepID=UPI002A59B69F|nr:protein phosphatase 1 regulatory subunit 3E-like [Conger conger]
MANETVHSVVVMLPPKTCIPKNYSCMAGLFGSLAAASQWKEDGEEEGDGLCESSIENHVVEERPRGRECFLKPPQSPTLRRRCKSLPTPVERAKLEIARSRSPTSHKKVRFADSLGLELTSVKHFCDADMPEVPQPVVEKFRRASTNHFSNFDKFPRIPTQSVFMEAQFINPGQLPGFLEKVFDVKVLLECIETNEYSLSGIVRVLNLAFEKNVFLRYTLNNWITFLDVLASYVPHSTDGPTDKFSFKIITPAFLESEDTLQFAIKYCVGQDEFWDNNNGDNYKVRRHRFKISPPREWENGWIHFI